MTRMEIAFLGIAFLAIMYFSAEAGYYELVSLPFLFESFKTWILSMLKFATIVITVFFVVYLVLVAD